MDGAESGAGGARRADGWLCISDRKGAAMRELRCDAFAVECTNESSSSSAGGHAWAARAGQWSQSGLRSSTAIRPPVAAWRSWHLLSLPHCHTRHSERRARPSGVGSMTRASTCGGGEQTEKQRDESRPTGAWSTNEDRATAAQLLSSCNSHHAEILVVSIQGGDVSFSARVVIALGSREVCRLAVLRSSTASLAAQRSRSR